MQAGSPDSPGSTTSQFRPPKLASSKWNLRVDFSDDPSETRSRHSRAAVGKLPASAHKKVDPNLLRDLGLKDTFTRGGVTKDPPPVVEETKEGLAKYDLDGDGIISAEEIEAAFAKYGWENDFRVWVMGRIGTEKLVQLECAGLAIQDCRNQAGPVQQALPPANCRLHCQSPAWLNCGGTCSCERYDPHLFLPSTCFSKLEMSIDIHIAARQLLDQCGLEIKDEHNRNLRSDDFIAVVDEVPKPEFKSVGSTATPCQSKTKGGGQSSAHRAFSMCAPNGGHLVCYRLKRGGEKLRSSFAEQTNSGVVSKKDLSKASLSMTEYNANQMLLPHLLKFCEEYRAVKVGQATETARMEAETRAREPWRAKGRQGGQKVAMTSAGVTGKAWIPAKLGDVSMHKTMPSRFDHAYEGAPPPEDAVERPRILCQCGHGELWHQPSTRPPRRRRAIEDVPAPIFRATERSPAPSRALPIDDAGRATICGGKLVLARAGTSTLQHSASAPGFGTRYSSTLSELAHE